MKYALLIYGTPGIRELPEDELNTVIAEYEEISRAPGVVGGQQLQLPDSATTVRVENGETLLSDGPFVDAKEYLGGVMPARGGRSRRGHCARRADSGGPHGRRRRGASARGAVGR